MSAGEIDPIRKMLSYNPDTGELRWLVSSGTVKAGAIASSVNRLGYGRVKILGKMRAAHRVAWALFHGDFPESEVDHVNGIATDNRIANLRLATRSENQCNRSAHKNNKSGYKGVNWNSGVGKWAARCAVNGKRKHIGYFDDVVDAASAYNRVAAEMHGSFYRGA